MLIKRTYLCRVSHTCDEKGGTGITLIETFGHDPRGAVCPICFAKVFAIGKEEPFITVADAVKLLDECNSVVLDNYTCSCDAIDECPLERTASEPRCTAKELRKWILNVNYGQAIK